MASDSELRKQFRQCIKTTKFKSIPDEFCKDEPTTWSETRRHFQEQIYMEKCFVPDEGTEMQTKGVKYAGDYIIGPLVGTSPVHSMVQCLARKKNKDKFYYLKILSVVDKEEANQDDKQGKLLLHTEHSLLSLLNGEPGVIQQHGLFQDYGLDVTVTPDTELISTGNMVRRLFLVLDCVVRHEYDQNSLDFINLQHYVIYKKKLKEMEALFMFANIVKVVERLHSLNVVHRDLKLANLVYNQRKKRVILTNFCLGQHLVNENERLQDQRGSPAYVSPDVLSGRPYLGKPSDMWALGVVLYTMLFGQFPFYHEEHRELFIKIKSASFTIPTDTRVRAETQELIKGMLRLEPTRRLTASQVIGILTPILVGRMNPGSLSPSKDDQLVPQMSPLPSKREVVTKTLPKRKLNEGNSDDEGDSSNQQVVPQDPNVPPGANMAAIFSRRLESYCYSHPERLNYSYSTRKDDAKTIKFTQGDFRSLTTDDIIANRSVFSLNAGSDLFRAWKSTASMFGNPGGKTRALKYAPTGSLGTFSNRTSARSTVPVNPSILHGPSRSNITNGLYEFLRARRRAMVAMNKINNQLDEVPTVPESEIDTSSSTSNPFVFSRLTPPSDNLTRSTSNPALGGILANVERPEEQASTSGVSMPSTSGVNQRRLQTRDIFHNPVPSTSFAGPSTSRETGSLSPLASRRFSMLKNGPSKVINLSLNIGRMETLTTDGTTIDNEDENSIDTFIAELTDAHASETTSHMSVVDDDSYDGDEEHLSNGEDPYNSDSSTDSNTGI